MFVSDFFFAYVRMFVYDTRPPHGHIAVLKINSFDYVVDLALRCIGCCTKLFGKGKNASVKPTSNPSYS